MHWTHWLHWLHWVFAAICSNQRFWSWQLRCKAGNESELVIATPKSISMGQKHPNKQGSNLSIFLIRFEDIWIRFNFFFLKCSFRCLCRRMRGLWGLLDETAGYVTKLHQAAWWDFSSLDCRDFLERLRTSAPLKSNFIRLKSTLVAHHQQLFDGKTKNEAPRRKEKKR